MYLFAVFLIMMSATFTTVRPSTGMAKAIAMKFSGYISTAIGINLLNLPGGSAL